MFRCSKCNRLVAAAGMFCICGALIAISADVRQQPYLVPDQPHIHNEVTVSSARERIIVEQVSTAVSTATGWDTNWPVLRYARWNLAAATSNSDFVPLPPHSTST